MTIAALRAVALPIVALALAAVIHAIPPEEPRAYDMARALRESWDAALLKEETQPQRRVVLLSSAEGPAREELGERVLIDIEGPGALTRISVEGERGGLRFTIDGAVAPQWETTVAALFDPLGTTVPPEFLARSAGGGTLHLPMLFSKSLRVVAVDGAAPEWIASVSLFPRDTAVRAWWPSSRDMATELNAEMDAARRAWRERAPYTAPNVEETISAPRAFTMQQIIGAGAAPMEPICGFGRVISMEARVPASEARWLESEGALVLDAGLGAPLGTFPGLLRLAGGSPRTNDGDTTGSMALSIIGGKDAQGTTTLRCAFPGGGLPFAQCFEGLRLSGTPDEPIVIVWEGQLFAGPAAKDAVMSDVPVGRAGEVCTLAETDSELPRVHQFARDAATLPPAASISPVASRAAVTWDRDGAASGATSEAFSELREEEDGSVVLELPISFSAIAGDVLLVDLDAESASADGTIGVLTTFEPNSGDEGAPIFPARIAKDRGGKGRLSTRLDAAAGHWQEIRIGDNASWPGGLRTRIVLRPEEPRAGRVLRVSRAILQRAESRPAPATATAYPVPLRWNPRDRALSLYPTSRAVLVGAELFNACEAVRADTKSLLYPDRWPTMPLECISSAPFGFRVDPPVGFPHLDFYDPAVVFAASRAGETLRVRHPALRGASVLAIRFGHMPDGARIAVKGSDGELLACEDLFLTDRYLPARMIAIELSKPNAEDFIDIESLGPAPCSTSCLIVIERICIVEADTLPLPTDPVPARKASMLLYEVPPRRPY